MEEAGSKVIFDPALYFSLLCLFLAVFCRKSRFGFKKASCDLINVRILFYNTVFKHFLAHIPLFAGNILP